MDIGTLIIILISIIGLVASAIGKNKRLKESGGHGSGESKDNEQGWPFGGEAWKDIFGGGEEEKEWGQPKEKMETSWNSSEYDYQEQAEQTADSKTRESAQKKSSKTHSKRKTHYKNEKKSSYLGELMKDFDLKKAVIYSEIIDRKEF